MCRYCNHNDACPFYMFMPSNLTIQSELQYNDINIINVDNNCGGNRREFILKKAEIILHPVRMRVIQSLVRGERMTAQQLQERLVDVPQATLYRHLKKLVESGVLMVAEEIPNRGTLEKVYTLPEKGAEISVEELEQASPDDHMTFFMNYLASLIGEYGRYIHQDHIDLVKDGVSYRQFSAYLTEEENLKMLYDIRDIVLKAMKNEPNEHRRKRLLSIIDFPEI